LGVRVVSLPTQADVASLRAGDVYYDTTAGNVFKSESMTSPLALYGNIPEILRVEEALLQMPQVDLPLQHFFLPGVCVRVMYLPAGTLLTGKIHKHTHIAILAKGTMRLADGDNAGIVGQDMWLMVNPE